MRHQDESLLRFTIDARLLALLGRDLPPYVREPIEYCLSRPGKRLRPLCTLHSCVLLGGSVGDAMPVALALELLHNFTLVHDDMMDGDVERRGAASVHTRFGASRALLAGDALLGLAVKELDALSPEVQPRALSSFAETLMHLCRGQALDRQLETFARTDEAVYLDMIGGKTASLFKSACTLGALCARADERSTQLMAEFGFQFGMAFQLRDDAHDAVADARTTALPPTVGNHRQNRAAAALAVLREAIPDAETSSLWQLAGTALSDDAREPSNQTGPAARREIVGWAETSTARP
jgi:geranylgeranyl pyrophosphate synthase